MKKQFFISIVFAVFTLASFGQDNQMPKAGSDKDSQGCKSSAGYTYSKLKKECIRVFEQKIKLNEVDPTKSYTSIVAVIFSQDKKNAELFIADEKESVILKRTGNKGNYIWKNSTIGNNNIVAHNEILTGNRVHHF
jgi:hypothetical protein